MVLRHLGARFYFPLYDEGPICDTIYSQSNMFALFVFPVALYSHVNFFATLCRGRHQRPTITLRLYSTPEPPPHTRAPVYHNQQNSHFKALLYMVVCSTTAASLAGCR